ncbi:hypothetical protein KL942_000125 [Ogataea angusta]|uniref:Uncharacterized protein n=1 Tax=Pichia angusta TaxID=870730 RepID=A0AAN6DH88_PICAN|nr:uncharacterized protein KL928_000920 [Ogataea angusta]KAG7820836.1 hypothetical protein KL928_000920 [Ogataea angusta]KAG7826464.1 hypothetical protein KL909_000516 [Ogataea angusta]KAG7831790.1 hypothetical protein KL920_000125 [Ogataea angusta]KAG7835963.1 hypothetical protein KL943_001612 [Ogataea angusta]KAG7843029.1 hypothetical protein KL942_000125 [Ogataea angusta]
MNSMSNRDSHKLQEIRLARAKLNTYKSFDAEEDFEFCPIVSSQRYTKDHRSTLHSPQGLNQIDSASLFKILAAADQQPPKLPQIEQIPAFCLPQNTIAPRQTHAEHSSKHPKFNYISDTPTTGSEAASSNASSLKFHSVSSKAAEQLQSIYSIAEDKHPGRMRIVSG